MGASMVTLTGVKGRRSETYSQFNSTEQKGIERQIKKSGRRRDGMKERQTDRTKTRPRKKGKR